MLFTGSHEHSIDAKNRLAIPSPIRNELDPERDGTRFYVLPGLTPGTLSIYTERQFDRLSQHRGDDPIPDADALTYDQLMFPLASSPLEPDKQGRIRLPEYTLQMANLGKQVVVIGVRDHLEVWNKSDYDAFLAQQWAQYKDVQMRARNALRGQEQTGEGK